MTPFVDGSVGNAEPNAQEMLHRLAVSAEHTAHALIAVFDDIPDDGYLLSGSSRVTGAAARMLARETVRLAIMAQAHR